MKNQPFWGAFMIPVFRGPVILPTCFTSQAQIEENVKVVFWEKKVFFCGGSPPQNDKKLMAR